MKNLVLLFLITFSSVAFSQSYNFNAPFNRLDPLHEKSVNAFTKLDDSFLRLRTNPKKYEIEGTVYAFEKWDNLGRIYIDRKAYRLNNVNFNMWTNTIEAQVGKDSVYVFDLANVEYASINNRKFKSFYFAKDNKNKIFEVLYEEEGFSVLKGYVVDIKRGEVDPLMVKKKTAKYYTTKTYYIKQGNAIEVMTLKKKSMLPLFKEKSSLVSAFVKENKLSYKKEVDLKKVFSYYKSL